MAYSIYQEFMNTSRFVTLAIFSDLFWICLFSKTILKRDVGFQLFIACFIAGLGYIALDWTLYLDGNSFTNLRVRNFGDKTKDMIVGPACCFLSRMFAILGSAVSKRIPHQGV